MSSPNPLLDELARQEYKHGFVSAIESDVIPAGLSEEVVRLISRKKGEPEWLLEWRLKAFRHWLTMEEPTWAKVHYPAIDYQKIIYYAAPRSVDEKRPKSLAEVDPELLAMYEKLGVPLKEREILAGVAVDAVFDSVSVATTFREKLKEMGVIFCSFSEAVREYPDLVRKYLGSVVPYTDNFFATLNSAVFSDGSFCYIPKGVRCPMELSTYFRINQADTGQFERTLIVADDGRHRQLPRGVHGPEAGQEPAPRRRRRARGPRRRPDQVLHRPELVPGRQGREGGHLQLRHEAREVRRAPVEDLLDAGGDGLGHHLEVPELPPPRRRLRRRVLLRRRDGQLPAGRYRDEDDPRREEHALDDRLEGDLRRTRTEHLPRGRRRSRRARKAPATTRSATRSSSATSAAPTPFPTSR